MLVNIMYWTAEKKNIPLNSLVLDVVKSYERKAYRSDGLLPPFLSLV